MLSVKPLCSIVLFPFSAILTNPILFIFHTPNITILPFTVKPFCNLSLPLSVQPHLGVLAHVPGETHGMAVGYSIIMVCLILLCSFMLVYVYS